MVLSISVCEADEQPHDDFLRQYAATYRFSLGQPSDFQFADEGRTVFFLRSGPRSFVRDLFAFDVATGQEHQVLTADKLLDGGAEQLTAEELARRERLRSTARGIVAYGLSQDGQQILIPLSGSLYLFDRAREAVRKLDSEGDVPLDPRFSPDGKCIAAVRNGDLYVLDVATCDQRRLTTGASPTRSHGLAEFVAQEEMDRMHGYWWSPDSRKIAYQETDTSEVEEWHIADPMKPGAPAQAWRYPRPGRLNARVRLGIIEATGGETTWIDWDRDRYPYLAAVAWKKHAPLTLLVQNREQTEELLLAVDAKSGASKTLLSESDSAWINIDPKMPRWLSDGRHFLWSTERAGAWQLELRKRDGGLAAVLAKPEVGYRGFLGIDEQRGVAYIAGGDDPTEQQIIEVAFRAEGPPPQTITTGRAIHGASFSRQGGTRVVAISTLEGNVQHRVYRGDSTMAGEIKSFAEAPPFAARVELTKVCQDPELRAAIVRPRDFLPTERYPVIVHVYGGPHGQTVTAAGRSYLLNQWLADQGFLVVSVDGRGTPARGRKFERAVHGNLIDLPLADQVRGLQALGAKYPEMDLSRVGIFGWSFGGYLSAMAVMQRPDVFHAAVAGAPVADWLDYDTHYTERYLGLPVRNPAGYQASSVLTHAPKLRRPLFIIHGTADDNVYFLHSLKMSDALFRAGCSYQFLPLPGFTHMVPDPVITESLNGRIVDFFTTSLKPGRAAQGQDDR
ncbi:MAG: DPP IV N-terminal domain-containing protein [Pirellulales bacterium]|nr:DPP IV N-terminal domain-containing protein [Pirellulales bacterium]